jgi:4a-hydroxytetrahydrobiopterin dehydratase
MESLASQSCVPCRKGEAQANAEEIQAFLGQIPQWEVVEREGVKRLERTYSFKNFAEALKFTNQVGELAEAEGHHPALQTEWGKVTVSWWTHVLKGLHRNDFVMAAKTDTIYTG